MSGTECENAPALTRRQWLELLTRLVTPEIEPLQRRRSRRYDFQDGWATLVLSSALPPPDPTRVIRSLPLMQVSATGIMVRSHRPLPVNIQVAVHLMIGEFQFTVAGLIVHSTQTINGYKVGIELRFAGETHAQPVT